MVALTNDRNTPKRIGHTYADPVEAGVVIYEGALVALNAARNLVPAAANAAFVTRGIAQRFVPAQASAGAVIAESEPGTFRLVSATGADAVTRAAIGADVFVLDDQTVALTNAGGTRPVAGRCVDVDAQGVWVRIGIR